MPISTPSETTPHRAPTKKPHVIILGAGIGGLTLAQALRKQDISFDIIERDDSESARAQGWCIALHSIIPELLDAFPPDMPNIDAVNHLLPLTLPCQICFYAGDRMFEVISTPDSKIIRANRAKLREWLGTGVDVQWGTKVSKIEEQHEQIKLTTSDGREVLGDILVGADGVNSQVRRHLFSTDHSELLTTLPIAAIVGEPLLEGEQLRQQLDLGASAYATVSPGFHLFAGLKAISEDGEAGRYYWFVNWHDEKVSDKESPFWTQQASKEDLLKFALDKTAGLDPRLASIVRATKAEEIRTPPIVFRDMELDKRGLPEGRVTLLGDAAHPMVPFRGEGGLHAMRDALNLAKTISTTANEDLISALGVYQKEMLTRGAEAVRKSRDAFSTDENSMQSVWGKAPQEHKSKLAQNDN